MLDKRRGLSSSSGPSDPEEPCSHGQKLPLSAAESVVCFSVWLPSFTSRPHAPKVTASDAFQNSLATTPAPYVCLSLFPHCFPEGHLWASTSLAHRLGAPRRQRPHPAPSACQLEQGLVTNCWLFSKCPLG